VAVDRPREAGRVAVARAWRPDDGHRDARRSGAYDWSRSARIAVLGIPTAGMLICSLVASVLAVLALREGDRSLVLLWPLLLGATAVLFLVGEFAVPH
jgi:heme/copper-type cytochrome/quinol oxidase subunit 3